MNKESAYLALNAIEGMTPRLFWRILKAAPDLKSLFSMPEKKILELGVTEKMARRIVEQDSQKRANREKEKAREWGAHILIHGETEYPRLLMEIPDPPPLLYVLGKLKREDRIALSIVGSRRASTQGRLNAERIAGKLSSMGITIISGLALGIDTWAHKGALSSGGRTIAVLGCGLDYPYPRYNVNLKKQIIEKGALISEFPFGTPPVPMNFPRRNRIISGFSMGTLVVEAANKSGSLITANFALEQGRDVFAIPGNIRSPLSSGVNTLIQKGAKLVQKMEDIVEELPSQVQDYLKSKNMRREEILPVKNLAEKNHDVAMIMKLIHKEPIHIDELTRTTSMAPAVISSLLMKMELCGQVRQLPGKLYIKE